MILESYGLPLSLMKNLGKWYEIIGRRVMGIFRLRARARPTSPAVVVSSEISNTRSYGIWRAPIGSTVAQYVVHRFVRCLASSAVEYSCKIRVKSSVKKWKSVYESPGVVGIENARFSTYPSVYKLRAIKSLHARSPGNSAVLACVKRGTGRPKR